MSELAGKKKAGKFYVDGRDIFGEISVDGENSKLELHDPEFFNAHADGAAFLHGSLNDLTKISLLGCLCPGTGSGGRGDQRYNFAEVFPHFVLSGSCHLRPDEAAILSIRFIVDDAKSIFYDFDAFAPVLHPESFIRNLVESNTKNHGRDVELGTTPEIGYFTGKREIFKANTVVGAISASHNPRSSWGGPDGIFIKNVISCDIGFPRPVIFDTALDALFIYKRFLELIAGRQQSVLDVVLELAGRDEQVQLLQVDWSMAPKRASRYEEQKPHPGDILLDAVTKPQAFASVLESWIIREHGWRAARARFSSSFNQGHQWDVDRLISAANVFDILPNDSFPEPQVISAELEAARQTARDLFIALPAGADRNSVLGALGRIGKLSLKKKITSRLTRITTAAPHKFPDIQLVLDEAVNCRNFFVHGGDPKFDYEGNMGVVWFFVNSLEFVFGISDLIDAGWDFSDWLSHGTVMSHPFCVYKIEYARNLAKLKSLLPDS